METTKTKLKELKTQMDETFTKYAEASRQEYIKTLAPGAPVPAENKIYGEYYLSKFRDDAAVIRSKVFDTIQAERKMISTAKTEAPTTEAVNTIGLMKLTSDLTADDIRNALDRFGDNYASYRAIHSLAVDSGLKDAVAPHKFDKTSEGLDYITSKVASAFSTTAYERNGVQPVSTLGFGTTVDNELPE